MKTYQIDGKPNVLEFTNYQRISESELFQCVMETLRRKADVRIGEKQTGPSEDFYLCTLSGQPFTLLYDVDYGPSIHSKDLNVIQELQEYFN